jgi:hypothetical protein
LIFICQNVEKIEGQGVENVKILLEDQPVLATSMLPANQLLGTIKKTGKENYLHWSKLVMGWFVCHNIPAAKMQYFVGKCCGQSSFCTMKWHYSGTMYLSCQQYMTGSF